jgi:hypothetical protein
MRQWQRFVEQPCGVGVAAMDDGAVRRRVVQLDQVPAVADVAQRCGSLVILPLGLVARRQRVGAGAIRAQAISRSSLALLARTRVSIASGRISPG